MITQRIKFFAMSFKMIPLYRGTGGTPADTTTQNVAGIKLVTYYTI